MSATSKPGKPGKPGAGMRFTSADLALMPDDGKRYEIIDGELYVSRQPSWQHQFACGEIYRFLQEGSKQSGLGMANLAPGLIFAEDDDVAPDIVWISRERMAQALGKDGKLHSAPELVVEVISPGRSNEERDRQAKLKLYSRCGVQEYWIVNWQGPQVEVYRREQAELRLAKTLLRDDVLESPFLPGFPARWARSSWRCRPSPSSARMTPGRGAGECANHDGTEGDGRRRLLRGNNERRNGRR